MFTSMLHTRSKQQRLMINKSFSKMAGKFEAFEMLAEEIDIESDVEVEEEEVKGYDDYEETVYHRRLYRFRQFGIC